MGKNLKGKECEKGICKRKDGQCCAGFVDKSGKQRGGYLQHFQKLKTGWKLLGSKIVQEACLPKHCRSFCHSSIKTAMDRYVPITDKALAAGIRQFEQGEQAINPSERISSGGVTSKSDSAA